MLCKGCYEKLPRESKKLDTLQGKKELGQEQVPSQNAQVANSFGKTVARRAGVFKARFRVEDLFPKGCIDNPLGSRKKTYSSPYAEFLI